MLRYAIILGAVVALSTGPILAQAKAPAGEKPTAKKAPDKAPKTDRLKVTVVSVSGIAEQRSAAEEKAKWTRIKDGDVLTDMTLIRTGLGGKVVLKFADRGNVTIKSGTKIGIASFRKTGELVKTTLGLKYGAIRAKVDSSQGANDFRVRTAVGTLAAKGTGGEMAQSGDFSFHAQGTNGSWQTTMANRVSSLIAGAWTDQNNTPAVVTLLTQQTTNVNVGDPHGGLTIPEVENLLVFGAGRGIVGFVGNSQSGGSPKLTPDPVIPTLQPAPAGTPGPLVGGGPVGGGDDPEHRHPR